MLIAKDVKSYYIVLTDKCFLRCSHCYLPKKRKGKVADLFQLKKIISRIKEITKYPDINWTGGDPVLLGKDYMRAIASLSSDCSGGRLYSTFLVDYDKEWKEILDGFSSVVFSLDSYRMSDKNFNLHKALSVICNLDVKKDVSYTPCDSDTKEQIETYYKIATDIGAETFYVGFLYSDSIFLHPEVYIKVFDYIEEFYAKYGGPQLCYKSKVENLYNGVGWRAYDCFTKGFFIFDDFITSCHVLYCYGYQIPYVYVNDFIEGKVDITMMNDDFVNSFFVKDRLDKCMDCDDYSLCMGGCPYFTWNSKDNRDMYCAVYRDIFRRMKSQW